VASRSSAPKVVQHQSAVLCSNRHCGDNAALRHLSNIKQVFPGEELDWDLQFEPPVSTFEKQL
jgi:hypothetical protein